MYYDNLLIKKQHFIEAEDDSSTGRINNEDVLYEAIRAHFHFQWLTIIISKNYFSITDAEYTVTHLYKIKGGYGKVRHWWTTLRYMFGCDTRIRISYERCKEHNFITSKESLNSGDILSTDMFGPVKFIEDMGDGFYDCIRCVNGQRVTILSNKVYRKVKFPES